MTLKEYIEGLQELIEARPELAEATAVYAVDPEGNAYHKVHYTGAPGWYDGEYNGEFIDQDDLADWCEGDEEGYEVNAVCIN